MTHRPPPGGPLSLADHVGGTGLFAGTWDVHGAQMVIHADGTGTVVATEGQYAETDTLSFARYRHPERLLATFTKVSYADRTTGRPIPRPTNACSLADGLNVAGDQFLLRFAAPQLLIESILVSHLAPVDLANGNPYWCGPGVSARDRPRCGA